MKHQHRRPARRLSIQSLESRRLLAAAAFSTQLYESSESGPGAEISGPIEAGTSFYLEVSGIEHDPFRDGFRGVSLNLKWDPTSVALIEDDFDLDKIFNPNLPAYHTGTFDQDLGRIYNLSAAQLEELGAGHAIGDGQNASIVILHFQALKPDTSSDFQLSEGASGIHPTPYARWNRDDIEFETESVAVVAANAALPETMAEDVTQASEEPSAQQGSVFAASDHADQTAPVAVIADRNAEVSVQTTTTPTSGPTEPDTPAETSTATIAELETPATNQPEPSSEPEPSTPPQLGFRVVDLVKDPGAWGSLTRSTTFYPEVQLQPTISEPEPNGEPPADAAVIDEVLSFDTNHDGIFDLADFGLLNVAAAATVPDVAPAAEPDAVPDEEPSAVVDVHTLDFNVLCTPKPPQEDVAAVELWLDALATAWLADSKARQSRREENMAASLLDTPGVVI